jgi:HD-GYP domain-containing protein (c-di-GMP phosphodiesterase class II)
VRDTLRIRAFAHGGTPMTGLERRIEKLTSILDVAKAMTEERDLDRLLRLIVKEATKVVESERSTLFIYDAERDELWSKVAEGAGEIRFPAKTGLAGAVVESGELCNIPDAYEDSRFNRQFDVQNHFRTRSILTVPMKNTRGEIVGVLQTLNKHDGGVFTGEDEELLLALAGVAAASITNARLHEEIEKLFEGFANAAVVAIESRDPTTAGHSGRVARVTVGLAEALDQHGYGRWKETRFDRDQMQEIRYAALLHDFGKVGVREHVLVKANKLYPGDLDTLEQRFETIRRSLQANSAERLLAIALAGGVGRDTGLAEERRRLALQVQELDEMLGFIRSSNMPTVLAQGSFERLEEIATRTFEDSRGQAQPFLSEHEVKLLSIRRGSLAVEEREEIESHVTHTYRFLSQIPWTRALRNVPDIAFGHHEKLTGKGYPRSLGEREIPVQTRMITISDIYDALTATDRPYKKALPHEKAVDILHLEAKDGNIDSDLLKVFVEADIARTARPL